MRLPLNRGAVILLATMIATPVFAQNGGADVYKSNCQMCHGADGLSTTPAGKAMKASSFKDPEVLKASDGELIDAVTKGKNKMPSYKGKLSDAQIKSAVLYIRTLQK